ncbi:MAG: hypothetical protein E6560_15780 [Yersiniaceae bacterium]|nr:hypothetical protein [Yersiniaceae bacterium]
MLLLTKFKGLLTVTDGMKPLAIFYSVYWSNKRAYSKMSLQIAASLLQRIKKPGLLTAARGLPRLGDRKPRVAKNRLG